MAKIGLEFGGKIKIADKEYRTFSDGLDEKAILGGLSWRRLEEPVFFTEDDTTKQPDRFGVYPQMSTGEVKWNDITVFSDTQKAPIFVSIVNMPRHAIEDLNLKLGDVVQLEGVVITWSNVAGGTYKIFADAIKRVDGMQQGNQGNVPKQHENKGKEEHKG